MPENSTLVRQMGAKLLFDDSGNRAKMSANVPAVAHIACSGKCTLELAKKKKIELAVENIKVCVVLIGDMS